MKKIISLVVVCMMMFCMMSITSFAATSAQHTVTLTTDSTTVKAGDKLTVTASLDTSEGINAVALYVAIPTAAFVIDDSGYNENLMADYELTSPLWANEDIMYEYMDLRGTKRWGDKPTVGTFDFEMPNYKVVTFQAAKDTAISASNAIEDMAILGIDMTVADNAVTGEYEVYVYSRVFDNEDGTKTSYISKTSDPGKDYAEIISTPLKITVEGNAPVKPEVVVETAEGVAVYGPIDVTNNDGSEYTINSALAFVSWVDNTKATPVKTVITRADAEGKELVIDTKHYADLGDKTYFVAAVSSIKENSIGKTFTATAYAKLLADGSEVAGAPATGVYTAPVAE